MVVGAILISRSSAPRPTYVVHVSMHYSAANMLGATPEASSDAINKANLPHVMALANNGIRAPENDEYFARRMNVAGG
mgnify:CR=1 FL=1